MKTLLLLPGDGIGPEVCAEVPPALSDEERARVDQWLKD